MHDVARSQEIGRYDRDVSGAGRLSQGLAHARGSNGLDYGQRLRRRVKSPELLWGIVGLT